MNDNLDNVGRGKKFDLTKRQMKECTFFAASSVIPDIIYIVTGNEYFEKLGFSILFVSSIALIILGMYLDHLSKN